MALACSWRLRPVDRVTTTEHDKWDDGVLQPLVLVKSGGNDNPISLLTQPSVGLGIISYKGTPRHIAAFEVIVCNPWHHFNNELVHA